MKLEERLACCKMEEQKLWFGHFSRDDAVELGILMAEEARKGKMPVVLDISVNNCTLFRCCLEGASPYNEKWIERKKRMVWLKEMSTLRAGYELEATGGTLKEDWMLNPQDYAAKGGGFPVMVRGAGCVGSICCSGLTHEEDHRFVTGAIAKYLDGR